MISLKDKIRSSIFLQSYFDTLGFNNSYWEFNFGNNVIKTPGNAAFVWFSIVFNFFSLGGFSNIDIKGWISSDDTILAIATGLACIKGGSEKNYIEEYLKVLPEVKDDKRVPGITTINSLEKIKRYQSVEKLDYSKSLGGNGAAMRTSVIGLIYYQEKDFDKLVENSIISSRITHNYPLGFLGGFVTALFTSYAVRDIPVLSWVDKLLEINDSGILDSYMKSTNIFENYLKDKDEFFDKWMQYSEQRINKFKTSKKQPYEFSFFNEHVKSMEEYNFEGEINYFKYGASGVSSLIVAYDSFLMSFGGNKRLLETNSNDLKFSLDSLIFFSTLNYGDNDTTGAIAGAWYGALYGFEHFDKEKLEQLEFKNELENLYDKTFNFVVSNK